jgi:hypothetical protein
MYKIKEEAMLQKQSFIKPLFWCFIMLLMVVFISNSPIEAQSTGGLNPLFNVWKMGGIIPGIPLNITGDVDFPGLTGQYQVVGRTSFPLVYQKGDVTPDPQINAVLEQLYTEDIYDSNYVYGGSSNEPRKFMVWVHYPAILTPLSAPVPYIPAELASAMQTEGVIADAAMFNKIHPHAYTNALLSPAETSYPVLIFSHGKNMHPLFYTTILEELASQGYIVVSIAHPHDVPASVFPPPDGDVLVTPNGDENPYVEWAVATNPDILTMYEIESRPKDVLLTLLSLLMMNMSDPVFAGHLDLTHVGMFGHSFGAGTSAWASQRLSQFLPSLAFSATLFLDTSAVPLVLPPGAESLSEPVMFMDGSGAEFDGNSPIIQPGDEETVKGGSITNIIYLMQTDPFPFYFFELETATHYTYVTDLMFAEPYLEGFNPYGEDPYGEKVPIIGIDNERALNIINTYAAAFFNKHLKNTAEPLLDGPSPDYLEVCFEKQPPTIPLCSWLYSCSPPPTPTPGSGVIPEPGTIVLFGVGLLGLLTLLRRKRQR